MLERGRDEAGAEKEMGTETGALARRVATPSFQRAAAKFDVK